MAPAGTPAEVVARLNSEIIAALRQPVVADRIANSGARAIGNSPDEFAEQISAERAMWGEIIKALAITPQ